MDYEAGIFGSIWNKKPVLSGRNKDLVAPAARFQWHLKTTVRKRKNIEKPWSPVRVS